MAQKKKTTRSAKTATKTAKAKTTRSTNKQQRTQNTAQNAAQTAYNQFSNQFNNAAQNFASAAANANGQYNPQDYFNNFQNLLPNFKQANIEQLMQTTQKNVETSIATSQRMLGSFKELAEKQAAFANRFFQDATSTFQDILTSNADPKQKLEETSEAVKDSVERLAGNARDTLKYVEKTANEVSTILTQRLNESLDELNDAA
jgi:phasin family protein